MLCDFQPLDDHRRLCRRCGLTVRVRAQHGRAVWAECRAIELGQPEAARPCVHLGPEIGLYTMFEAPLSGWDRKPSTIWDDFEYGSSIPVPGAVLLGMIGLSVAGVKLRRSA